MPQPELIRHLNTRFHGGAGRGGSDHFEVAGTQEVQARFGGRLFRSLFQPVVARGGELLGHEALLQVQGPGGEGVSPRTIFELASDEEALALDHMACTLHVLNFARQGHGQRGLLALNLSPRALLAFAGGQEALFQAVLAACGLSPQRVVLEVTDHGFEDCTALAAAIAQCRGRGYHTAIDNFGRFSCDIERLEALAPDIVKLDRCLIGHAGHLGFARQVLGEMCAEIRRLGMRLVSQSIERPQQLQAAMASGADLFQGYLIGRPSAVCLPLGHAEPRVCEMSA